MASADLWDNIKMNLNKNWKKWLEVSNYFTNTVRQLPIMLLVGEYNFNTTQRFQILCDNRNPPVKNALLSV